MNDFKVFHDYNRVVRRGAAEPLTCETCNFELTVSIGAFDEPVLRCLVCQSTIHPGLRVYDQLKNIVDKYFKEIK